MRAVLALLASLSLLAGLAWHLGWRLPAAWNPWAPLDVRQPQPADPVQVVSPSR